MRDSGTAEVVPAQVQYTQLSHATHVHQHVVRDLVRRQAELFKVWKRGQTPEPFAGDLCSAQIERPQRFHFQEKGNRAVSDRSL